MRWRPGRERIRERRERDSPWGLAAPYRASAPAAGHLHDSAAADECCRLQSRGPCRPPWEIAASERRLAWGASERAARLANGVQCAAEGEVPGDGAATRRAWGLEALFAGRPARFRNARTLRSSADNSFGP